MMVALAKRQGAANAPHPLRVAMIINAARSDFTISKGGIKPDDTARQ
ncbi:MAG TPA: hypothetical protein VEC01_02175 [Noviherbaspirillum sp.]|nr:hypothetical protein [Noviherbaspirillum sp.]HYD94105.1 hypothetical protein [Noviherbaspirillum sp.]